MKTQYFIRKEFPETIRKWEAGKMWILHRHTLTFVPSFMTYQDATELLQEISPEEALKKFPQAFSRPN